MALQAIMSQRPAMEARRQVLRLHEAAWAPRHGVRGNECVDRAAQQTAARLGHLEREGLPWLEADNWQLPGVARAAASDGVTTLNQEKCNQFKQVSPSCGRGWCSAWA